MKSLSLTLADPSPHYEAEIYTRDRSQPPLKLKSPIGFDGLYRKSEPTVAGVFATKGKWVNGSTLEVERQWVGMDELQKWTLSFDGDRLICAAGTGRAATFRSTVSRVDFQPVTG